MKTKRNKHVLQRRTTPAASSARQEQLFSDHLRELRRRAMFVAASVIGWAAAAYFVQQYIVAFLLKPAGSQQFIYTSPGGGMNFLVSVCLNTGIVMSIPVIVYNMLKFIEPLLHESSMAFIRRMSLAAAVLAIGGMAFGYYLGLPHTLHFLAHQFQTNQIRALIAIQSYMAFVTKFLLGSALIFQAPLVLLLINRIKPLKPASLFKYERWVILLSFILGGLLSPTPDIRPMLLLSAPMVVMYQIGIAIIWKVNRTGRRSKAVLALFEQDLAAQAERLQRLEASMRLPLNMPKLELVPEPVPITDDPEPESRPVLAPVTETMGMPSASAAPAIGGGRTNYLSAVPRNRVRRRLIM